MARDLCGHGQGVMLLAVSAASSYLPLLIRWVAAIR